MWTLINGRPLCSLLSGAALLFVWVTTFLQPASVDAADSSKEDEPGALASAREDYKDEIFRKLEPIQEKYRRALEQYQISFTRQGDIESATEASREADLSRKWETVPTEKGQRPLKNPLLNSLQEGYEKAALEVIQPAVKHYVGALDYLKKGYSQAGNLEATLKVEAELSRVRSGRLLPAEIAGKRYLAGLSKDEFEEWLWKQTFAFTGTVSGLTEMRFEKGKVIYGVNRNPIEYPYILTDDRTVEIEKGEGRDGFIIAFSRDLQSAFFKSNRGSYPVSINGEQPAAVPGTE